MTDEELERIRERARRATRPPWGWHGYLTSRQVSLEAGGSTVMEFRRWGTQGAQPMFSKDGLLVGVEECAAPDTCAHRRRVTAIDNPDATFIAHSRQDVEDLLAEVDRLRAEVVLTSQAATYAAYVQVNLIYGDAVRAKQVSDAVAGAIESARRG